MTAEEGVNTRHRWWRYRAYNEAPVPCGPMEPGAFRVRWVDLGPPLGVQAVDDRFDEQGLMKEMVIYA